MNTHRGVTYQFNGTNGWWGWPTAAQVSRCGKYKQILGGPQVYGKDAYIYKNFTDLPPHSALRIQATLYKIRDVIKIRP